MFTRILLKRILCGRFFGVHFLLSSTENNIKRFIFLYFAVLNPCFNITCYFFAVCKVFGPFDARCVCIDYCPSYNEPVCSSNGTQFKNTCIFQRSVCYAQKNDTLQPVGLCVGKSTIVAVETAYRP